MLGVISSLQSSINANFLLSLFYRQQLYPSYQYCTSHYLELKISTTTARHGLCEQSSINYLDLLEDPVPSVGVLTTRRMSRAVIHRPFPCLRYTSTALRMYVLLGISPRTLSILCNIDLGRVIPTFSVLSTAIVPFIPILYIALPRIKDIDDYRPTWLMRAIIDQLT